ncbi:REPAT31 protein [Danaus plexippus plexippus]|uniref:REPAT31 protein n=2 Tax=Danaus plexippus TaxID=13037 RepID=A0A212FI69_DANPL|nr:REPAT31 protein [Danaus plexippus plexippus]
MKRVKFFFYNTPDNRPIRGIQALDPLHTKSSVNVTAGGVGFPFVNLRMKSERGKTMVFDIGIYVDPDLRY